MKLKTEKVVIKIYNIGILQLIQHLDDAVKGLKDGLSELNIECNYHYLNSDGNEEVLPDLANQLLEKDVDVIFACSTPSARAAKALKGEIPVVFTPVFDPVSVGLVEKIEAPEGKVTGVSGMVSAKEKVEFIKKLLPEAKVIGFVYHSLDPNSCIEKDNFMKACSGIFTIKEIPVEKAEDLSKLSDELAEGIDAVFMPIGRIIEENFATVLYYTEDLNIPVIAPNEACVTLGALGALVANHYYLGKDCAQMIAKILNKVPVKDIPVEFVKKPEIVLNRSAAEYMGIEISGDLINKATNLY